MLSSANLLKTAFEVISIVCIKFGFMNGVDNVN